MLKRTIYIGTASVLKLKDNQLLLFEPNKSNVEKGKVAIEDMALLVLDHYQITLNTQLLLKLQSNNVAIVNCDAQHLPFSLTLPFYSHTEFSKRVNVQIQISEPLKKQLWRQTVIQKIKNQAEVLKRLGLAYSQFSYYIENVKSGDSTNMEGIAAQNYWKHLFPDFKREREGDTPNDLLNFAYSILRSLVARALVSSGLQPVFGLFHKNKYNPYCLADDIMEPYRPYVDLLVYNLIKDNNLANVVDKQTKAYLLGICTQDVLIDKNTRPLMVALTTTTSSLYKCYLGEERRIKFPEL